MIVVIIIGIILFVVLAIVWNTFIGNVKNRAKQSILKDTPFSNSAMNNTAEGILGKRATNKFLEEYGNIYTEDSIKERFKEIGEHLVKQESMSNFSEKVNTKMQKDSKLLKIQQAQITRVNIMSYAKNILTAFVVYDTGRDEYMITIQTVLDSNGISEVRNYSIQKGVATGF